MGALDEKATLHTSSVWNGKGKLNFLQRTWESTYIGHLLRIITDPFCLIVLWFWPPLQWWVLHGLQIASCRCILALQAHTAFPLPVPGLFCDPGAEAHLVLMHVHPWTLGGVMSYEIDLLTKVDGSQWIKSFSSLCRMIVPYTFSEGPIGLNNQLSWLTWQNIFIFILSPALFYYPCPPFLFWGHSP